MVISPSITVIEYDDLSFRDDGPAILVPDGEYRHALKVDPYRCYGHDPQLVEEEALRVASLFPLYRKDGTLIQPHFFLPLFEGVDRCNGLCMNGDEYKGGKSRWLTTSIILWGKRIPPMPLMTRYLVAHEYGHAVERAIEDWKFEDSSRRFTFLQEYATVRGVDFDNPSGRWHTTISEIFANDFRFFVCEAASDFWPHPCPHPTENIAVSEWWAEQFKQARAYHNRAQGKIEAPFQAPADSRTAEIPSGGMSRVEQAK